ncbi:hypothetical protein [Candidatus Poriferisodalis sp.]|uniref:hypothetical protein n=1 Tax=Candidatus Poriferisodalis sp. TaxID=3101277 RepID=UPI003B51F9D2
MPILFNLDVRFGLRLGRGHETDREFVPAYRAHPNLFAAEREADRRDAGRRAWKITLALPAEVVVLFAGAAAILEWQRG